MKKFLFLLILFPFFLLSQVTKKYPGLLWKISGQGLKEPSYLYGTMHVSNRVAYNLSEEFFNALEEVDVVGLETNPGEWLADMERSGELSELTQMRQGIYNKDFYKGAFAVAYPEKRMLQGILSYDPDIINGLLYRQNKSRENFEENTYIDLFIFQTAAKLNKKVISLEDFTQAEIKARLSALPDAGSDREGQGGGNHYANVQKIEDAYREGNLDLIDSLSRLNSSRNMQKYLISDRNVFFVNTIDSVLKTSSLFAGVGAAHLPGSDGLIELLRAKGYSVEPVKTHITRKSDARREAFDKKVKPVDLSRQFAPDSLFSLNLPGKLYPIVNLGHLRYDIHADMVNGSFYTVVRLRYNGPVFGLSAGQMLQRVDSLLFENIPGRIISRRQISSGAVKGLDVLNRTRRGDEQRYQIFFTDQEMIVFKLGSKGNYASGNEAKQVFASLRFHTRDDAPAEFTPPAGGFRVRVPASCTYLRNESSTLAGPVEELCAYDAGSGESFGVRRAVYNDFNYLEEDSFELNRFATNVLQNYRRSQKPAFRLHTFQGFPAISFSGSDAAGSRFLGRLVIKGVHYYLVYMISSGQDPSFEHPFFGSFVLNDFKLLNPLKEITDDEFHFTAVDEVSDNALSRFNEAYAKAAEATVPKKETGGDTYGFYSGNKFYYSPSSNEYVSITYEKYNDYDYRDPLTIAGRIEESLKNNSTMFIARRQFREEQGMKRFDFILSDTATARAIDVRIFFKGGIMLEVCAPFDTTIGLQGWTRTFMESFKPGDTLPGKDIFVPKFDQLLSDLSGSDTLKRRQASVSLAESVSMQPAYTPRFIEFLSDSSFARLGEENKALLFVNGGMLKNDSLIDPYKKLYMQHKDSFYLQLCLLKGLAINSTARSFNAFRDLLLADTPLAGDENTINDVFTRLYDSVSLCREFYPDFLSLTRYEEYRNPVYALMAKLAEKGILPAKTYSRAVPEILRDADLALKRHNAGARTSQSEKTGSEKMSHELEMAIRTSIESMAAGSTAQHQASDNSYGQHLLMNYATVLAPFYKSDAAVRSFLQKLSMVKTREVTLPLTVLLLKQDLLLNDTMPDHFAADPYTRVYFYLLLKKEGLTAKFNKKYLGQESFITSVLAGQRHLSNTYGADDKKNEADSLVLIKELAASNKFQKGRLFVYSNNKGARSASQWSAVFVPDSAESPSANIEVISSGYYPDKEKSETENLNELLEYFALSYRKRALANQGNYE